MPDIIAHLTKKLKLKVNEQKSRVILTDQATYLGHTFRGMKLRWSDESFADFKLRIRVLPADTGD